MALSDEEESLITVVRGLPPDEASRILNWALQLADRPGGKPINWSDSWSDEDLADATAASLRYWDEQEANS